MSKAKLKNHLMTLAKVLFALVLLYFVFGTGKIEVNKLQQLFNPALGIPLVLVLSLNIFLGSERWRIILKSQGLIASPIEALKLTLIGSFFNFAIPGGVGGDLVKGFYFVKQNVHARLRSAITILIDRLLGLFTMTLMGVIALFAYPELVQERWEMQVIATALLGIFAVFCLLWAFVFSKRLHDSKFNQEFLKLLEKTPPIKSAYQSLSFYRHHKDVFFKAIGLSLLTQTIAVGAFIWIGYVMQYEVSLSAYFFAVPVGFIITSIPISPAGIGVGQAAFYFLFNLAHHAPTDLGPISISMIQVTTFILSLAGAFFYIRFSRTQKATAHST
jgi:uncharacterized protein (TIRG00374 family)